MEYLASCGSNLKLFEVPSYTLKHEYNPFNGTSVVKTMSFSNTGELCVAVPEDGYLEVAAFKKDCWKKVQAVRSVKEPTAAIFQRTLKKQIAVGLKSKELILYDLKNKVVKKHLPNPTDEIALLDFCAKDSHLAVGCQNGDILLYNVGINMSTEKLMVRTTHNSVSAMRFHSFQRSLFAAANDVGDVVVWDINTKKKKFALKNSHSAPCADIAFSPLNNTFMTSIGYDCTFNCYDLQNNMKVISKLMEYPLCSHDIMHNGIEIAMGTRTGMIYLLDLRNCKEVVAAVKADTKDITNLEFKSFGNVHSNSDSTCSVNISSDVKEKNVEERPLENIDSFFSESLNSPVPSFETEKQNVNMNVNEASLDSFFTEMGITNPTNSSMTTIGEDCAKEIISEGTNEWVEKNANLMDRTVMINNDDIPVDLPPIPVPGGLQKKNKSSSPFISELISPCPEEQCSVKEPMLFPNDFTTSTPQEQFSAQEKYSVKEPERQVNLDILVDKFAEIIKKQSEDMEEKMRFEFMNMKLCIVKQFVYHEQRMNVIFHNLTDELNQLKSEVIDLHNKLRY